MIIYTRMIEKQLNHIHQKRIYFTKLINFFYCVHKSFACIFLSTCWINDPRTPERDLISVPLIRVFHLVYGDCDSVRQNRRILSSRDLSLTAVSLDSTVQSKPKMVTCYIKWGEINSQVQLLECSNRCL